MGVAYNALTGRAYPHTQLAPRDQVASQQARYNQVLDVSRDDLKALLQEADMEGMRHRLRDIHGKNVMTSAPWASSRNRIPCGHCIS